MMRQKLVLVGKNVGIYRVKIKEVDFSDIYNRKLPISFLKVLRHTKFVSLSLAKWKKEIKQYNTIIVFDADSTIELLEWLAKKSRYTRKIFCYRNCISSLRKEIMPDSVASLGYELWSYNLHDCEEYGLNYNNQMLRRDLFLTDNTEKYEYDVLFLGEAKGRGELLINIQERLCQMGLTTYFYVTGLPELPDNKCLDEMPMPYTDYIQLIYKSRVILDVVLEENYGLTFRALEAMFAKRKMITNYQEITRYDFYNKNNIYILENDINEDMIMEFIESKYEEIPESIVDRYSIERWLERF